jgi:small basic protein
MNAFPGAAANVEYLAGLRSAWTRAFVVGELIGFVPPALTAAIGTTEARVLGRYAPDVPTARWVRATVLAAGLAWFAGMGGSALMGAEVAPPVLLATVLAPVWAMALTAMGYLQWRVLRVTVPASGRWVPVTTGAWLIGIMIPVVALSTVPNDWPVPVHVAVAVAAAVAMGFTVGALTGRTLHSLLAQRGLPLPLPR